MKRNKNQSFKGLVLPLGARIWFLTPKGDVAKFAPKGEEGLFLGWHLQPGGRWDGDYVVMAITEISKLVDERVPARVMFHRVKEVWHDQKWVCFSG